jgi:hypothetical protein
MLGTRGNRRLRRPGPITQQIPLVGITRANSDFQGLCCQGSRVAASRRPVSGPMPHSRFCSSHQRFGVPRSKNARALSLVIGVSPLLALGRSLGVAGEWGLKGRPGWPGGRLWVVHLAVPRDRLAVASRDSKPAGSECFLNEGLPRSAGCALHRQWITRTRFQKDGVPKYKCTTVCRFCQAASWCAWPECRA